MMVGQYDISKNQSGMNDPTAAEAIKNVEAEERADRRFAKLLKTIWNICELSGFHIEGRFVVKDNRTGKIYD